jgi:hypothetical protein
MDCTLKFKGVVAWSTFSVDGDHFKPKLFTEATTCRYVTNIITRRGGTRLAFTIKTNTPKRPRAETR